MNNIYPDPATCPGQEETAHLYLDGELSPAERVAFAAHLEQCPACQTLLTNLQSLFAELAQWPEVDPPGQIVPQVMAYLPAPQPNGRPALIGYLLLAGQIAVGLGFMLTTRPLVTSVAGSRAVTTAWLAVAEIATSLAGWVGDVATGVVRQAQTQWPPTVEFVRLDISSGVGLAVIAGLALAWIIGNGLLLRQSPPSIKNGGI